MLPNDISGKQENARKIPSDDIKPSQATALDAAIEAASQPQLSSLLRQLCAQNESAAVLVRTHLTSSSQDPKRPMIAKGIRSSKKQTYQLKQPPNLKSCLKPPKSPTQPPKRKHSTQCRNCGSHFSPETSYEAGEICTYHPGKREVDPTHEVWKDFDSNLFGDDWTLMDYENFHCGFQWSCCKRGTERGGKGCAVGAHKAAPLPMGEWKRTRRV